MTRLVVVLSTVLLAALLMMPAGTAWSASLDDIQAPLTVDDIQTP